MTELDYDPSQDPAQQFLRALPPNIRHHVNHTARITVLVHKAVRDHGHDPTTLAKTISKDLAHRSRGDVQRLILFRLTRAAGMDDDEGDAQCAR